MRAWAPFARLLPLPGLAVMAGAGVIANRYTPSWFEVDETCINRHPCFSEEESASVLRSSAWMGWAGLLLVVLGLGLCAWAQSSTHRNTPSGRGAAVHAGVSGLVAVPAAAVGLALGAFGAFLALGGSVYVIAWLTLATVLEALDLSLGRARSDRAAYLLSLESAIVGLVALGGTLAVLGLGRAQFVGALALSGLSVAAVTALGDVVQDRHFRPWAGWTAAAVTGLVVLGGALDVLGLLEPPKVFAPGTWSQAEAYVPLLPRPRRCCPCQPPSRRPSRPRPRAARRPA